MEWLLVLLVIHDGTVVLREEHRQPSYEQCRDVAYTARSCEVSAFCVPALAQLSDCARADFNGDNTVGLPDLTRFEELLGQTCK